MSESLVLLLAGWCSGISVYLTAGLLGICGRMNWLTLPSGMETLEHPLIILIVLAVFAIEFLADKVPYVDSAWDSVHTFIRPLGAAGIGALAGTGDGAVTQTLFAALTGTLALNTHVTKASARLAINTSPEPFSNIAASVTENAAVFFMFWFFIKHPWIAAAVIILLLVLSFLFIKMMWGFVRALFRKSAHAPHVERPSA
jgi:hypothetical protein